jgi:hypothetical protein
MSGMIWITVRLELAPTAKFPRGSTGRAFLLSVPIDKSGRIDRATIERDPARATVRRFWASEPDSFGTVEAFDGGWNLRCRQGAGLEATFLLDETPLNLDSRVNVRSPKGTQLPFRVVSIHSAGSPTELQ